MGANRGFRRPPRFHRIPLGEPWCEALELNDGRRLIVRPIQPSDADRLRRSFGELTPEEIRFRFLRPIRELTPKRARELARIDRDREFALVLVEALPPERARIGGVGRAVIESGGSQAEFALIVGREIGGFGLGSYLLRRLIEWCRKKGVALLYGHVMTENDRMLNLARRLGFRVDPAWRDAQVLRIERRLRAG
jgi:RimJ/RimL family protein N-acetyltransferase